MSAPLFVSPGLPGAVGYTGGAAPPKALANFAQSVTAEGLLFPGTGAFVGTVRRLTTPVSRHVFLYDRASGKLARKTVSGLDGRYRFDNVDASRTYFVIALDRQPGGYRPAGSDNQAPS